MNIKELFEPVFGSIFGNVDKSLAPSSVFVSVRVNIPFLVGRGVVSVETHP
jgi:hypothetical protein